MLVHRLVSESYKAEGLDGLRYTSVHSARVYTYIRIRPSCILLDAAVVIHSSP